MKLDISITETETAQIERFGLSKDEYFEKCPDRTKHQGFFISQAQYLESTYQNLETGKGFNHLWDRLKVGITYMAMEHYWVLTYIDQKLREAKSKTYRPISMKRENLGRLFVAYIFKVDP